jgi:hypothetical protein
MVRTMFLRKEGPKDSRENERHLLLSPSRSRGGKEKLIPIP